MLRNKWTGSLTIVRLRQAHPYIIREAEGQRGSFCDVDKFGLVPSELNHVKRSRPIIVGVSLRARSINPYGRTVCARENYKINYLHEKVFKIREKNDGTLHSSAP